MKLRLIRKDDSNGGVFKDLSKYRYIHDYLDAILNHYMHGENTGLGFCPLNCGIYDMDMGKNRWIIRDGQIGEDASGAVDYVRDLCDKNKEVNEDWLFIYVNEFDSELFINWRRF